MHDLDVLTPGSQNAIKRGETKKNKKKSRQNEFAKVAQAKRRSESSFASQIKKTR